MSSAHTGAVLGSGQWRGRLPRAGGRHRFTSRFTHRVCQGQEVVFTLFGGRVVQSHQFPATGGADCISVGSAEVVGVRLGVDADGAYDHGGVGIGVGQGRHGRGSATVLGTTAFRIHEH